MWEMIENGNEGKVSDIESAHAELNKRKARIRWYVALTLINNPSLVETRKREMQKAEEPKGPGVIKQFATKVVRRIEDIKENYEKKHETKL